MFGGSSQRPKARIDSLIAQGTVVTGDVHFTGGLRVDGWIKGNVLASDKENCTLILSDKGRIEGEIQVASAVINGTVVGPVDVAGYLELQSQARVRGDVCYRVLEMQVGAVLEGRLAHRDGAQEAPRLALPAAAGVVTDPVDLPGVAPDNAIEP